MQEHVLILVYAPQGGRKSVLADKLRSMASDKESRRLAGATVIETNDARAYLECVEAARKASDQ